MRKIKFRAWDLEKKKMYQCVTVACDNKNKWITLIYTSYGLVDSLENQHVVMQNTGLFDVEEKEIYEGDILLVKDRYGEYYCTVHFKNGAFYLDEEFLFDEIENFESKIVGNIYENADLLKLN